MAKVIADTPETWRIEFQGIPGIIPPHTMEFKTPKKLSTHNQKSMHIEICESDWLKLCEPLKSTIDLTTFSKKE